MATDDPNNDVRQLVDGVLRDVRAKVEDEVQTLVSRVREHADAQKQAAIESARAAAEAKAREAVAAAESSAREAVTAAEAKAREGIAAAEVDAARRADDTVARTKEDARRLVEAVRVEAARTVEAAVADARAKERLAELAGAERLLEAVRAFDHARSLSEVLHLLADKAAEIAPRVAVLTVEGRTLRSWRLTGFDGAFSDMSFEMDVDDGDLLGETIRTGLACTTSTTAKTAPTFAQLSDGRVGFAVPLEVGGHTVAVLYADDDGDDRGRSVPSAWPEVAELLTRHAARCLQALTGSRIVDALTGGADPMGVKAQEQVN